MTNKLPYPYGGPWVAAQRIKRGKRWVYERHAETPEFMNVRDLIKWLEEKGLVTRGEDEMIVGWGNPWYACSPSKTVAPR